MTTTVIAAAGTPAGLVSYALFALPLLVVLWMVLTARRRAREAEHRSASLAVGQRVVTTSGLIGTLVARGDGVARLEVAPGVVLSIDERALMGDAASVLPQPTGGAPADPSAPPKEAD